MSSEPCPICCSSLTPKSKSHLLEKDLNYQLELLSKNKPVCFYSLHFFPKCPQCQKPRGHLSRIETVLYDAEVKTQVKTYCLLVQGAPIKI